MIRLYAKRWRVYLWWKVRAQACAAGCLLVENNWVCEIWTIIYSFRALLLTSLKKYRILSVQFSGIFWGFFFLGLKNDLSLPESILAPQTVKGGHFSSWSDHNRTTPSWPQTFFKKHTLIKKNYSTSNVHFMYIIMHRECTLTCTFNVHVVYVYMYIWCTLLCTFNVHVIYVHMYIECTVHVHWMYIQLTTHDTILYNLAMIKLHYMYNACTPSCTLPRTL